LYLFTDHCDLLPEPLGSAAADPVAFSDTAGALTDYSLARRADNTLIVHRLVQDVTRHRLFVQPAATVDKPLATVLALLQADLQGQILVNPESWPRWQVLLPSVLAAIGHYDDTTGEGPAAWLLDHAGIYLQSQGRYGEALPLLERALRIDEAALGPDHPDVATDLNHVGWALSDLGRSAEALPLQERALRIDGAALGSDHPDVASDLNNVGQVLSDLDRPAEALPLYERALRIHEAALGPDHPEVATDLNHVGWALSGLGRFAEALPLYERALRIREASLGPDHPSTRQCRLDVEELKRNL
jgi:tetratricopeptide (TPR) repeat protein